MVVCYAIERLIVSIMRETKPFKQQDGFLGTQPCVSDETPYRIDRIYHWPMLVVVVLLTVTIWSYWQVIVSMNGVWQLSDHSVGQLVPLLALYFLWRKRQLLYQCHLRPCWRYGPALVLAGEAMRILGCLTIRGSFERYSLPVVLAGLVLWIAGKQVFQRIQWILAFLLFMVPLPASVRLPITVRLQSLATSGSVFLLEAFGIQLEQQGNVLTLGEGLVLGVAEACSGLRMLMAFFVVAGFVSFMVDRSRKLKLVLLLSSMPLAVLCNIIRICLTALMMIGVSQEFAETFFHDFAGLVMMPAAVLLLFGELWLLDRLFETGNQ
jgi:exosortase